MLNVCARGKTVREAQTRAYAAVDRIHWPEGFCRRDIGWRAIEREKYERIVRAKRGRHTPQPIDRLRSWVPAYSRACHRAALRADPLVARRDDGM